MSENPRAHGGPAACHGAHGVVFQVYRRAQGAHRVPAAPRYTSVWDPTHIPPHHITVAIIIILIHIHDVSGLNPS